MKKTNTCCKCASKDVIKIPGETGLFGVGNNVPVGFLHGTVNITRYFCSNCGYIEEWVDDIRDIKKLEAKYKQES